MNRHVEPIQWRVLERIEFADEMTQRVLIHGAGEIISDGGLPLVGGISSIELQPLAELHDPGKIPAEPFVGIPDADMVSSLEKLSRDIRLAGAFFSGQRNPLLFCLLSAV